VDYHPEKEYEEGTAHNANQNPNCFGDSNIEQVPPPLVILRTLPLQQHLPALLGEAFKLSLGFQKLRAQGLHQLRIVCTHEGCDAL
jgi:hypothetical protein